MVIGVRSDVGRAMSGRRGGAARGRVARSGASWRASRSAMSLSFENSTSSSPAQRCDIDNRSISIYVTDADSWCAS
jgi:hypothetical protein